MLKVILNVFFHEPYPFRPVNVFDPFSIHALFDETEMRSRVETEAAYRFRPVCKKLVRLCADHANEFKVVVSLSGCALESFKRYCPDILQMLEKLSASGCVEFTGETYYHSASSLFDIAEFREQVFMHAEQIRRMFGKDPFIFRNALFSYDEELRDVLQCFRHFGAIFTESGKKSSVPAPFALYRAGENETILLLNSWNFSYYINPYGYEQIPEGDIFSMMLRLFPAEDREEDLYFYVFLESVLTAGTVWERVVENASMHLSKRKDISFVIPSEILKEVEDRKAALPVFETGKPAGNTREISLLLNDLQRSASETLYSIIRKIRKEGACDILSAVRRLTSVEHLLSMAPRSGPCPESDKSTFGPCSPEEAYSVFLTTLARIEEAL